MASAVLILRYKISRFSPVRENFKCYLQRNVKKLMIKKGVRLYCFYPHSVMLLPEGMPFL